MSHYCERARSEGNSSLPGNKVILPELLGFGPDLAARNFNNEFHNGFAHLLDGFLSGDDRAGININDVWHALRQPGVGGNLNHGRYGIAGRRSQTGSEEHNARAGADLAGDCLNIIAGRAQQIQAGFGCVLGIIENRGHRRRAAFLGCSGRFHRVGDEPIANVAGRRIHIESRIYSLSPRINCRKRLPTSSRVLRFTSSCSTPHNSGNSASIPLPPRAAITSATWPIAGLAEMPENPSDPPHFNPTDKAESGAGVRSNLLASTKPKKVWRMACDSISNSVPLCCCSKISNGLLKLGSRFFSSSCKIGTWACWQPRLRIVAPATLGWWIYPANRPQRAWESSRVPPHPPSWVRNLIPSTLGNTRRLRAASGAGWLRNASMSLILPA